MSWHPPYHSSKFRHVYGRVASREQSYNGLQITGGVQDSHCCAVNPQFIAVVTESTGGGAFIVIPVRQTGRVDPHHARVCGHQARVLDVKWDPFNDQRIASCSEDCTVKVWDIPKNGLKENIIFPRKELIGHARWVGLIEWHPTAKDVLLSSAYDYQVCVWRLDTVTAVAKTPVCVIRSHTDLVLSVSFSEDGSRLATTCRDRNVRVLDPRTGHLLQGSYNQSHKAWKVLFLTNLNLLLTTGTSLWNQRQYALWDPEDLSKPLLEEDLDGGCGVVFPFYDPDTHMLYLAGKGDGNIRYYEVSAEKPYIHFLAEHRSLLPQRGMGVMPKRGVDTKSCEVFRFYRLVPVKDLLEPLSFLVPRKSDGFQEDIYPMTAGGEAAMTAQEWLMGQNRGPILMSLKPGSKIQNPYPAPVEAAGPDHSANSQNLQNLHEPGRLFPQEEMANQDKEYELANQHVEYDISDLSGWQEDETQGYGVSNTHTPDSVWPHRHGEQTWPESDAYTLPVAEKEMWQLFYMQREEIRSLRQQLDQRDNRIQQLELEIKNMHNQHNQTVLRAEYTFVSKLQYNDSPTRLHHDYHKRLITEFHCASPSIPH
ncbi:coronin-2B [Electrophorus electricus]|uniref:coronin-2B n=1 Tax=Electrophorus electricus TaxID=8005 RepID=UPI000F0A6871|nr:coronin-2B [Electrophorus electricus]